MECKQNQEISTYQKSELEEIHSLKEAGTILGRPKEEYVRLTEKLEQIYWVNYRENAMHKIENLGKYGFVAQLSSGIIEFHIFASLNDIVKLPPDSISFVTVIGGEKKWYEENARKKKKSKGRLIPSPGFLFQFQVNFILKYVIYFFLDRYVL